MVDFLVHWFDPDQLRSSQNEYGQAALLALDRDEVGGLVRQLTALPESRRPSLDLLGRVEDALAAACTGDAGPVMALPSSLRQAIELRAGEPDGLVATRLWLLDAALAEVGDVPLGDTNDPWLARAERLDAELGTPAARLMHLRWLAACWHFSEAEAALSTIDSPPDRIQGSTTLGLALLAAGQVQSAVELLERAAAERERVLGPTHSDTLASRHNLAVASWHAGRASDAVQLFRENLAVAKKLDPAHPRVDLFRKSLERAVRELGERAEPKVD